jgi:hypothetical protein
MAEGMASQACADMVDSFVKRIEPKDYETDYSWVTGAMRRSLRRMAGKCKAEDALAHHTWTGYVSASDGAEVDELELDGKWQRILTMNTGAPSLYLGCHGSQEITGNINCNTLEKPFDPKLRKWKRSVIPFICRA